MDEMMSEIMSTYKDHNEGDFDAAADSFVENIIGGRSSLQNQWGKEVQ